MSAKVMLGAMLAGGALMIAYAALRSDPQREAPAPHKTLEKPWLSREAATQIIGDDGTLGPLFAGIRPGGPPPSPEARVRLDAFARANDVQLHVDEADGRVTAVHFAVTFGGCCGYEGADWIGLRLRRPRIGCEGCPPDWADDWTHAGDDGVFMRGRIRVNRVAVRWEKTWTLTELLDHAEHLLGADAQAVRATELDRWHGGDEGRYRVEVPYAFRFGLDLSDPLPLVLRRDLGLDVSVENGRVTQVAFELEHVAEETLRDLPRLLESRWGRPKLISEPYEHQLWRLRDREITVERDFGPVSVRIRATEPRK